MEDHALLTLLFALAIGVAPAEGAPKVDIDPAPVLTREEREQLAMSALYGSPDDPIRARAGRRERPAEMTERQAWALVVDGNTHANLPAGPVTDSAAAAAAINAAQDAEARERRNTATLGEMIGAAWDGTITTSIGRAIARHIDPRMPDPDFNYAAHMRQLEDGRSLREREELRREALSLEHARELIARQDEVRENNKALQGVAGGAVAFAVRVLDPAALMLIAIVLVILWSAGGRRLWNRLRRRGDHSALAQ